MSTKTKVITGVAILVILLLGVVVFSELVKKNNNKNADTNNVSDSLSVSGDSATTSPEDEEKNAASTDTDVTSKTDDKKNSDDDNKSSKKSDTDKSSDSSKGTETAKASGNGTTTTKPSGSGSGTTAAQPSGSNTSDNSKASDSTTSDSTNTNNSNASVDATTPVNTPETTTTPADNTKEAAPADTSNEAAPTDTSSETAPADTSSSTETAANDNKGNLTQITTPVKTEEPVIIEVTGVSLDESSVDMYVDDTLTLNETVSPVDATDSLVYWSSGNTAVATVDGSGSVTAIGAGNATITVTTVNGKTASCLVNVRTKVIPVSSVTLDKSSADLYVDDSVALTATVSPEDATEKTVTWVSSNTEVATVDGNGVVTAVGAGTAVITAASGDKAAAFAVTVTTRPVAVTSVTLDKTEAGLQEEDTLTLSATVLPADATDKSITWVSSDEGVATVSSTGIVTAKAAGTATITVTTSNDMTATCAVTVTAKPEPITIIDATSVSLDQTSATLYVDDTVSLAAIVTPADATDKAVTWSTSDDKVATVNESGIVTAVGAGNATITVTTVNGKTATFAVTVNTRPVEVASVSLDKTALDLYVNDSASLTAIVSPADATEKEVSWTTSNSSVVTVSDSGEVTAKGIGTATVIAAAGGKTAVCVITVTAKPVAVTSVSLSISSMDMYIDDSLTLTATVLPIDATDKSVTWSSDNAAVATVSDTGTVKAVSEGTAVITATTSNGKTASCSVTVKKKIIEVSSISLNTASADVYVDGTLTLTTAVLPADATDKTVTWTSSNTGVATVTSAGTVKGIKTGTATITAKSGNKTATCTVTVKVATVEAISVSLNNTEAELQVNETISLAATIAPDNATDKSVTWSSSAVLIAVVDSNGKVTAKSEGTAVITAKTSNGKTATCTITVEKEEEVIIEQNIDSLFKVPYISTYYFNPKPSTNDNIQIPLYLTDYYQSEYLLNDTTKTLDLLYEVDGVKKYIRNIPMGDYTLTIGKLSAGMHTVAVQAIDNSMGTVSPKLYNDLWVVDPSELTISASETYYMTQADLTKYSIHNDDSTNENDLNTTRDGLTQMFKDLQAAGYRKVVLLKGTYRINGIDARTSCIMIPSYFTVDMNGSTFKLDPIYDDSCGCIVTMYDVVDAHLTNGTLEGDRFERKAEGLEVYPHGEPINTFIMNQAKYSSITNMTIKNTSGHTIVTGCSWDGPRLELKGFTRTAIVNGKEVANENCSTTSMIDLTSVINYEADSDYMYVGFHAGYRGIKGESGTVYVSFYDSNQNFMETVTGFQYRKMAIPSGAKYARVTLLGTDYPGFENKNYLTIHGLKTCEYDEISNISFYDTRTTCMAPTAVQGLLIENCKYTRCGNSVTPCPVDFEDGWDECQDVYYRNNEVIENAENTTTTVVDCAGFNHVYENCINHRITTRSRLYGACIRNCNGAGTSISWDLGDKIRNGYGRIYNNNCGKISFGDYRSVKTSEVALKVKDCYIKNDSNTTTHTTSVLDAVVYENCTFPYFSGDNATLVNCTVQPAEQIRFNLHFYDCTFKVLDGVSSEVFFNFSNIDNVDRVFENCTFEGKTRFSVFLRSAEFKNCTFDDLELYVGTGNDQERLTFENCDINSTSDHFLQTGPYYYSRGYLNVTFKDCNITHTGTDLIYLFGKPLQNSQILFSDCTINKSSGVLLSGYTNYSSEEQNLTNTALNVIFSNSPLSSNLTIDKNYADLKILNIITED